MLIHYNVTIRREENKQGMRSIEISLLTGCRIWRAWCDAGAPNAVSPE
ncbi:hypothetical protein [Polluticaenibacter yanchengensis]|uniref:Uncharacterized protein n=1 Tax=Polluticaenibacter yanchengensis TaxID=3014562 RepID=A0ABT4ULR4_9BACT|nr:hypothetical protein [Chitinophagaceae bacterium LY-5]